MPLLEPNSCTPSDLFQTRAKVWRFVLTASIPMLLDRVLLQLWWIAPMISTSGGRSAYGNTIALPPWNWWWHLIEGRYGDKQWESEPFGLSLHTPVPRWLCTELDSIWSLILVMMHRFWMFIRLMQRISIKTSLDFKKRPMVLGTVTVMQSHCIWC
jgi:hypothetical protein